MQVLVGQIWKYVGDNRKSFGEEYLIIEILPAVKRPGWDWHTGIRYVPLEPVETAPNDYTRFEEDFLSCFQFVREER